MRINVQGVIFLIMLMVTLSPVCAENPQACFSSHCVDVEIARTAQAMEQGLSGHRPLTDNQGMLFMFQAPGQYGFWMKDMTFDLDIIWMDQDGKIVDIKHDFKPCTPQSCPVYKPAVNALYVLEVNAGYCQQHNVKVGDIAVFQGSS